MMRGSLFALFLTLAAPLAQADEEWSRSTEPGNFIYEGDTGEFGLITYPIGDTGLRGAMFVDGLAGNNDQRMRFTGYWTEPARDGTPSCAVDVVDATGEQTDYWGRIEILFVEKTAPSEFILLYGMCFDEPDTQIVASPVVAE